MSMSPDEMVFVSLTSTLDYIMSDINAQRDLFMFATTVENFKRDVLSHRFFRVTRTARYSRYLAAAKEDDTFA